MVEVAGQGIDTVKHALQLEKDVQAQFHGSKMYLIQDENGQVELAHSISARFRLSRYRS